MRLWLGKQLNTVYVKVLLRAGKWTIVVLLLIFFFVGAGFKWALPQAVKMVKEQNNTQLVGPAGSKKIMYKDKALPKDFRDELDAEAPVLIYENQLRSVKEAGDPHSNGQAEDAPLSYEGLRVPPSVRRGLLAAADSFLSRWEEFSPGVSQEEYLSSLAPYVDPQGLPDIVSRADNIQSDAIAPGGQVGSHWETDGFTPASSMAVRRYDGDSAYLTMAGEMTTAGPSLVYHKSRYIRSYSLVMVRSGKSWKVRRAAAQTLAQVDQ
jgi:hypothetical protein